MGEGSGRQGWQLWTAVAVLLVFGAVAIYMLAMAAGVDADVWQRRVYVFSGVQAIAFTAVGWLFGREVNSGVAAAATDAAAKARAENRQVSAELADTRTDASSKESAVRATLRAIADQEADAQGAGTAFSRSPGATSLQRARELVEEIYDQ